MPKLRTVSWVLLAIVGVLALVGSVTSASLAYGGMFAVGGVNVDEVAQGREAVLTGLRGARGTAAAWAAAWAVLLLVVVLGPYRKGDVAMWWGILASALVMAIVVALRVVMIDTQAGTGTALVLLLLVILALLIDVKRLSGPR